MTQLPSSVKNLISQSVVHVQVDKLLALRARALIYITTDLQPMMYYSTFHGWSCSIFKMDYANDKLVTTETILHCHIPVKCVRLHTYYQLAHKTSIFLSANFFLFFFFFFF